MNSKTSTKRALKKVRALVETNWAKGSFSRFVGATYCHCLGGAAGKVVCDYDGILGISSIEEQTPVMRRVLHGIHEELPEEFKREIGWIQNDIYAFNDAPETTLVDVLAVLDRAIAHA